MSSSKLKAKEIKMKKYIVYLEFWDWDTAQIIEAENATKAKGEFIKNHKSMIKDYKNGFFIYLRAKRIK